MEKSGQYAPSEAMRAEAEAMAKDFLENETEYQMGYVEAEQSNPITRTMGETFPRSTTEGVKMLLKVDCAMAQSAKGVLAGEDFSRFAQKIFDVIAFGGRVVLSGCGSSGRLCMQLERAWRTAVASAAKRNPKSEKEIALLADRVETIMTGGDYAVIRAVEMFEDYSSLGRKQAQERKMGSGDLLLGVTATGETTSILGTASQALEDGAEVYMLVCSDPASISGRMARAREVYSHPRAYSLYLPCGAMALTGSTRMQSSSFEQFIAAVALEEALCRILQGMNIAEPLRESAWYGEQFCGMTESLTGDECINEITKLIDLEKQCYSEGALVTYFATDYLLDVLTDTTERSPTFMTPPFRAKGMKQGEPSWAFVKNPLCDTPVAWHECFAHEPRCIDWQPEVYLALGADERAVARIPAIDQAALNQFPIGSEPDSEREGAKNAAIWIGAAEPDSAFTAAAARYGKKTSMTLWQGKVFAAATPMEIFSHLAIKLMLNTLSTGTMACMGRITGNWMTNLAMSNKKLVDRGARIVADQCGLPYPRALAELYCAKIWADAQTDGISRSPAQLAIQKNKKQ